MPNGEQIDATAKSILRRLMTDPRGHGDNAKGLRFDSDTLEQMGLSVEQGDTALKVLFNQRLIEAQLVYGVGSSHEKVTHMNHVKITPRGESRLLENSEPTQ